MSMLDGLVGLVVLDGLIIQARPDQTTVMRALAAGSARVGGTGHYMKSSTGLIGPHLMVPCTNRARASVLCFFLKKIKCIEGCLYHDWK